MNLSFHPKECIADSCYEGSTDVGHVLQQQQLLLQQDSDLSIWPPFSPLLWATNCSSSSSNSRTGVSVQRVLGLLHEELCALLLQLQEEGFSPIRAAVAQHLAFKGQPVSLLLDRASSSQQQRQQQQELQQQQQQQQYSGVLEGLGPDGSLLLRMADGSLQAFSSGRLLRG